MLILKLKKTRFVKHLLTEYLKKQCWRTIKYLILPSKDAQEGNILINPRTGSTVSDAEVPNYQNDYFTNIGMNSNLDLPIQLTS